MRFQEIFNEYHNQVQFLNVYIREAHPKDGWWLGLKLTKKPILKYSPKVSMAYFDPKVIDERRVVANDCINALDYSIPIVVDKMDDQVNKAYAAWPTRLYLVGLDGRIVYAGGMAPYHYKPAEFKAAIEAYLKKEA